MCWISVRFYAMGDRWNVYANRYTVNWRPTKNINREPNNFSFSKVFAGFYRFIDNECDPDIPQWISWNLNEKWFKFDILGKWFVYFLYIYTISEGDLISQFQFQFSFMLLNADRQSFIISRVLWNTLHCIILEGADLRGFHGTLWAPQRVAGTLGARGTL